MPTRRSTPPATSDVIDTDQETPVRGATEWRMPVGAVHPNADVVTRDDQDEIETTIGERIRDLVAQSGSDRVRIKVYRRDPRKANLEYCQDYSPEAFDDDGLSMLRDDWGPGEYELRVIGSTGILARPRVNIAPMRNQSMPVADNSNSETAQLLRAMAEQNTRILDALTHRPDPMAQMQPMLAMMAAMREAMGMNNPPAPPPAPASLAGSLSEMALTLKVLKEISGEITPKDVDSDNPMALAMPILEVVKTALQSRGQMQAAQQPATQPAPRPPQIAQNPGALRPIPIPQSVITDPPTRQQPETQPESEPEMLNETAADDGTRELREALDKLVTMAKQNAPIEDAATFVADSIPEEILPMMETPFWFGMLCQIAPELRAHETWVRAVKDRADALLYSDSPADTGPES